MTMHKLFYITFLSLIFAGSASPARAEFMISSAIIEFNSESPRQQDIEAISRSKDNDYLVSEISEIINPGMPNETRKIIEDPSKGGLLVSPDKTILTAGGRKVLRFILLREPDDKEHIYRITIKPVIKGLQGDVKIGLKILIGYEVLVIVRPKEIKFNGLAKRVGKTFTAINNGNTNILFQNGKQCITEENCQIPPVVRVYPGETRTIQLPFDAPVWYSIWDGKNTMDKQF